MSETAKKPQRLDKNGRPYPDHKEKKKAKFPYPTKGKGGKSAKPGKPAKKKGPEPVGKEHPVDWFYLHPEACTVDRLKEIFLRVPELDVEVWPELQILELTLPNGVFIDFEYTGEPPQEPGLLSLLEQEKIQTVYYVSVEPFCSDPELDLLLKAVQQAGGLLAADTDSLKPQYRG